MFECFIKAIEIGWKIIDIACGQNHTMAVINSRHSNSLEEANKLFVWGCSNDWQLGIETGPKNEISDPI